MIPAAGAVDAVNQAERRLFNQARPHLSRKGAGDLVRRGKRPEQALHEAEADIAAFIDQLESRDVRIVRPNLAVADDAVAGKLKAGKTKLDDAHINRPNGIS